MGERYFKRNSWNSALGAKNCVVPLAAMLTWQKELSRERLRLLLYGAKETIVRESCSRRVEAFEASKYSSRQGSLFPGKIFFACFYSFPRIEGIPRHAMERVGCRKPPGTGIEGNAFEERATDEIVGGNFGLFSKFQQIGSICNFRNAQIIQKLNLFCSIRRESRTGCVFDCSISR